MRFISLFVFCSLALGFMYAQPWEMDNAIFNPSGIPSMTFSQPRFNDLDADGDWDFWLGNTNRAPLFIENIGATSSPEYQVGTDYLQNVNYLASEMAVNADLNGDGVLDLITGGFSGLHFFVGTTEHSFSEVPGAFSGVNGGSYPVPDLADIDGDGDLDMIVGFSESGVVKLYLNTGTSTAAAFDESNATQLTDVGLYAYPVFCDFDGDGDTDILIGRDIHGFVYLQNDGSAQAADWQDNSALFAGLGMDTYWNSGDLADINGDGLPDLLYGTADGPLRCYINTGSVSAPVWQENATLFGGTIDVGGASSPFFCDFDADGDMDMLLGTQMGYIKYYENTGTMYSPAWTENSDFFSGIDHSIYAAVTAGDVNTDGFTDVIVGDLSGNLFHYRNTGTALVYNSFTFMGVNVGGWSCPRLIDWDFDGDLDLAVGNEDGYLVYLQNIGTSAVPNWQEQAGFFTGIDANSDASPTFGDFDEDGDIDVLAGDSWGDLHCYLNEGGVWIANSSLFAGITTGQNAAPALADLDHDGDLDLVLGDYDGTLKHFRNLKYSADTLNPPQNPGYDISNNILVYWEAPAEGSTSPFVKYNLYMGGQLLGGSVDTSWLMNLLPQGEYQLEIRAEYIAGESIPAVLTISIVSNEDLALSPAELQNHPNPFKPFTTISFDLIKAENARLEIFNVKGQLIRRWSSFSSGHQQVVWDGRDESGQKQGSGLYFYRLSSSAGSYTGKMLMLK
ncbi:MAG TPA: FG-GAP-like repeat-containing protein [Candidatus Cloacimonadota bacterium]|nr:FG-GAP-like repeat-containing protein [Candidatus Cloacimonadota bacterium]